MALKSQQRPLGPARHQNPTGTVESRPYPWVPPRRTYCTPAPPVPPWWPTTQTQRASRGVRILGTGRQDPDSARPYGLQAPWLQPSQTSLPLQIIIY